MEPSELKLVIWQEIMRNERETEKGMPHIKRRSAEEVAVEAERIYTRIAYESGSTGARAAYLEATIREEIALRAGNDALAVDRLSGALHAAPK